MKVRSTLYLVLLTALALSGTYGCGGESSDTDNNQNPPVAQCGDGVVDAGEGCDDSNLVDGDGCDSVCQLEDNNQNPPPACVPSTEVCDNGTDEDCDDLIDTADSDCIDGDNDGFLGAQDCNDGDAAIYPGATEVIGDGIDQDCTGMDKYLAQTSTFSYSDPSLAPQFLINYRLTVFTSDGLELSSSTDSDPLSQNGFEVVSSYTYTFYPDGKVQDQFDDYDANLPGPDYQQHYTYDAQGRIDTMSSDDDPSANDGYERVSQYAYDPNTSFLLSITSSNSIEYYSNYDAAGNPLDVDVDVFKNGIFDYHYSYTYDSQGRSLSVIVTDL